MTSWIVNLRIAENLQARDEDTQKVNQWDYIYLTAPEMDHFVNESTRRLFRIYQQLWIDGIHPDGPSSTLDLVL